MIKINKGGKDEIFNNFTGNVFYNHSAKQSARKGGVFKKIVLPEKIKPGDPRNAMGIDPAIRIHGTNDKSSIGKRISRGCIRLRNEDILKLAEYIENKKIKVLFIE
ncbi:L,D-transpeptidase [Patescibacteria group bacterium]|nr:L,D-transpeptidase [Patescibacteria group bacterium]MBU2219513.1 L,D-transpeptidase [Patescibacteria group bacterium]MBU2263159.1 L,D-transpeptidase [Patescibacteria group bacterium]